MTRKPILAVLALSLLWTNLAVAGDSDSDSDSDRRSIAIQLSALSLRGPILLVESEPYTLGPDVEAQAHALVETYDRIGEDSRIELEAWEVEDGPWALESMDFDPVLLDAWELDVAADGFREATPAQVLIDGNLYLWDAETFERLQRYVWAANCVVSFIGWTKAVVGSSEFSFREARLGSGCRLKEKP